MEENSNSPKFIKKPVDTPILDFSLREKISTNQPAFQESGLKAFYVANKPYFWAILAGVLIIGALAFLAFRKPAPASIKEANVSISVEAPQAVANGGEAVYKITLKNDDGQKLTKLQLELTYPEGMSYQSSSPKAENLSGTLFKVPDLISGQNATVFLKTKVSGNVNDEKKLSLKLHYSYNNLTSEFVKETSYTVRLLASNVALELEGPSTTNNAQLVIYTVKYKNNSEEDIKNARIKMIYGQGFRFATAQPAADLGQDTWTIGTLAKNASGSISIQGTFDAGVNSGESKTTTAQFLILGPDGQYFTQNSADFSTSITSLPLLVSQSLSQENPDNVINPGDFLTFHVRYQNNANTVASGVNIVVSLDSRAIDLTTLRAEGGQVNNNTILWNAATVPQLENLAPNESGELSFSIKVNNPAVKDSSKNLTVISNVKIKANEYDSYFPGAPFTLKISSPTTISRFLSFVAGSLPPKVGTQTTYKVRLTLTNSSNDFSNGVVTAFIPLGPGGLVGGSWTMAETNNVQYDSSTGKLTWNVGSLPANTGRFNQPRALEFQVKISPSASQAGQAPVLVKDIEFIAKDIFTGQNVQASAEDVTTSNIQGQDYGSGYVEN